MLNFWSGVRSLITVRERVGRWIYVPIIGIQSFVGLWGIAEAGFEAAWRSIVLIALLVTQFFWPTVIVWCALTVIYGADALEAFLAVHLPEDYVLATLLYGAPCAAILWARPWRIRRKALNGQSRADLSETFGTTKSDR
jgi:hypothetical protein